jgi:glutamate-1-semialdehyde 2,1-aminomutase
MNDNVISQTMYGQATQVIPGGVNSPVRAFKAVGLPPRFIRCAKGCRITDEDGNEFIDYVGSWGPMILGHAHPEVIDALARVMHGGTSFGAPTWREVELARLICELVPSVEMVRLVNSGTEATMAAIRLARGFTGRDTIIKFSGCYHGHSDGLLAKAGSGAATFSVPDSMGVPAAIVENTVVFAFNDLAAVRLWFEEHPGLAAALILEPVVGNAGVLLPQEGFLPGLREICTRDGALLIFDEVMTGFRLAPGGAQEVYGIKPDLTCMGKVIGGGLPLAAFGGSRTIMEHLAPVGGVYQAGTLSGNPLAVTAGLTTLRILRRDSPYAHLERTTAGLADGLGSIFREKGITHTINRAGSMISVFFHPGPVTRYEEAVHADREQFSRMFARLLDHGVYLPPSPFEAWFLGAAHGAGEVDATLEAVRKSL